MKVIEHLAKAKEPLISFELIPPKRGGDFISLLSVIEEVSKYNPPFIDITSHPAEVVYEETSKGIKKIIKRKRPGTLGICALIQNKYNIDAVPHVLTNGFTREETEDFLIELNYLGIENVLAIRGDDLGYQKPVPEGRSKNIYAADLVKQIVNMNNGKYLEESLLDAKPTNFYVKLPQDLVEEVNAAKPEQVLDIGVEWAVKQVNELLDKNIPSVHFYIMQNSKPVKKLMERLKQFKKIA